MLSRTTTLIFSLFLVIGCSGVEKEPEQVATVVTGLEELITPDSHPALAFPSFIRTTPDYFLIYARERLVKFSYDGEELLSFGKAGRGPGEFQSLTNYWILDDHYLLYDYNGSKLIWYGKDGTFWKEQPVNNGEITTTVEHLSDDTFVHPVNGENGALLKTFNLSGGSDRYFGRAVAEHRDRSHEDEATMVRRGEIPERVRNLVFLGVNESGIFSFQQAEARLQKFSGSGELLWEKDFIDLPTLKGVYEEYLQEAKTQERFIPQLSYARGIHVYEEGAAILLQTAEQNPVTVLWVSNSGEDIRVIEYPEVEKSFILRFRIAPERQTILFVDSMEATIFRAEWLDLD